MRTVAVLALWLLYAAAPAHSVTLEEIPTPRPAGWSVDLTGRIPPATLQEINRLGDEVRARTGAEIAVAVVGSLKGVPSHDFAVGLFKTWGIGDRARNNGVLVLAALDDHKAEVVLGSGIDTEQTRRISDEIMQTEMIPRFRAGDPGAAVLAGAKEHVRRILDVQAAATAPGTAPQKAVSQPAAQPVPSPGAVWIAVALLMFASVLAALGTILWLVWRAIRSWIGNRRTRPSLSTDTDGTSDGDGSSDSSSSSGFSGGTTDGGGSSGQW